MQIVLLCSVLAAIFPSQSASAAVAVDPTIRVGLFYGTDALPGANLLNSVGSGYRLGYFDHERNFVQLGETAQTAISVVKTQNVYYGKVGSWSGYYDSITSDILVGCYHLQLPGGYSDFSAAKAAAASYTGGFAAWIDGSYFVRVGSYSTGDSARAAQMELGLADASVVGTSSAGVSVVATGTSTILFQFDSTQGLAFGILPGLDNSVQTKTIFRGNTYFGGFQYQRVNGGNLTVSNVLSLEDYVQGVVIKEMSASWPVEALKAQAVCARTYAYRNLSAGKHSSQGFDICNTVHCQAYAGIAGMSETSRRAVDETYGMYAWSGGSLAETTYFSSDGGATESAVNVWGSSVSHLIGKEDPYEAAVANKISNYNWTVTYTSQELTQLLNQKGYTNSGIVDFRVSKTTPTGNVLEITFTDSSGKSYTKTKESCRTLLGLRSQRYTVSGGGSSDGFYVSGGGALFSLDGAYAVSGDGSVAQLPSGSTAYAITNSGTQALSASASASGTFTITGSGWGHNVGMSQWGAYAMAQSGYTYDQILKFYYTGIDVRQP